jgi:phosphatidylserine/phosphatidylglycerophosphate/cardiolipin synthase-like enzyme
MPARRRLLLDPGVNAGAFADLPAMEAGLVNRMCKCQAYVAAAVPKSKVDKTIVAFASPDSTWVVTRRLIREATKSILVGTYDFTATYVSDLLAQAVGRGVMVELMLDLDGRSGELPVYDNLAAAGVKVHPAPACGPGHNHVFPSCHEKVTVIDGEWVLVQSGNYTENSIPANDPDPASGVARVPGNRDMGLAIRSKSLATLFTKLLKADIKRATKNFVPEGLVDFFEPETVMFDTAPTAAPTLVPEKSFELPPDGTVQAVLSPDNYMAVAEPLLRGATTSIDIEQQYIRPKQPQIKKLLAAIDDARAANPALQVRIILAAAHGGDDADRLRDELALLESEHDLKLGEHIRLLNKKFFVHCHNKLIVVDGERLLVGSQNWSDFGVSANREAGIRLDHAGIAGYFTDFVEFDWQSGVTKLKPKAAPAPAPQPAPGPPPDALAPVLIRARYGDYADV